MSEMASTPLLREGDAKPHVRITHGATYFQKGFAEDCAKFQAASVKTGFGKLDQLCDSLYPGLHVIGAQTGDGKTSFVLQLAAQAAEQVRTVLYVGFESDERNWMRVLSQSMAWKDKETALSSVSLLYHGDADEAQRAMLEFSQSRESLPLQIVCPTGKAFTPGDLRELMDQVIQETGQSDPLVIVDSLEFVRPDREVARAADTVDEVVRELFWVCRAYELPLLLTSNIILPPCCIPVDVTAFPDDSQLIDLASTVFAFQPACFSEPAFQEMDVEERRAAAEAAYRENPRRMELQNLKNRNGPSDFSMFFHFYPEFGLFEEL